MPRTSLARWGLTVAAASALLVTGACKSPLGSDEADGKASPSATPTSAAPTDNGVAAKPAKLILREALAALRSAKAVRVKGRMRSGGDMIRISMRCSPTAFAGFIRAPVAGRPTTVEMRQVNGKVYGRYGSTWKALGSSRSAAAQGMDFTVGALAKTLKPTGRMVKGKPTKIAGQPAIGLRDSSGWLYVATTGKPYPLRISSAKGRGEAINFTEYDKPFTVAPPPGN